MTSPTDPHSLQFSHINGTANELLDRLAVSELCKGWPVYRDASEWANFRSLFAKDTFVWTTWSGVLKIDAFIEVSKQGKKAGAFIQHRECGTLVELNPTTNRAVGKMKATITQRFVDKDGTEYDVDCDCRFLFFCEKASPNPTGEAIAIQDITDVPASITEEPKRTPEWKAHYVKLVYEKDKVVSVDGKSVPNFTKEEMEPYPEGYKYLGAAQARLDHKVDVALVTLKDEALWFGMYKSVEKWLAGEFPDLFAQEATDVVE